MDVEQLDKSMETFGNMRGTNLLLDCRNAIKEEINKVAGNVYIGDEITYCEKKSYLEGLYKAIEIVNNKIHSLTNPKENAENS